MKEQDEWVLDRGEMVQQMRRYGIRDERILVAMQKVRRHCFIPEPHRSRRTAYGDHPWEIGHGQTISQPYIVAYMIERLGLQPGQKVLEIGTGSGYEAAILAELGLRVYTVERIPALEEAAVQALAAEGYGHAQVLLGDGYRGWPEHAPYDGIVVSCAPDGVPPALVDQMGDGGRMIVPIGSGYQRLVMVTRAGGRVEQHDDLAVRFVPMVPGE